MTPETKNDPVSISHPGLPFVRAKGFTAGRPDGPPLWIVWHTTEQMNETLTSAEAIANYIADPGDGRRVSYSFTADANSVLQLVECSDSPWAAGSRQANNRGIHYGLVGRASQTRAQWLDPFSRTMLDLVAPIAYADQERYGIPMRQCTVADLRAGRRGHTTHNDCRLAFGGTTHTDPGPNFPWDYLFMAIARNNQPEEDMARLTFFMADGGYWRSNGTTIRRIQTGADFRQIADRGDCFPGKDANGFPTPDIILDPNQGGWTWEQIYLAYGPDEVHTEEPGGTTPEGPVDISAASIAEIRDAVADLGEGGAAQVRADA